MNADDILHQCLEDIATGRRTPAQCADKFPHVPGLRDELTVAQALMSWPPPTIAQATARRHQAQLRAALAAQRAPARRPAFALPRWAPAALLMLALVLSGAGTVSAASYSLPGQALYPVKRTVEAVQGTLTPAGQQSAWHTSQAETRTSELLALAEQAGTEVATLDSLAAEIGSETEAALANVANAPSTEQARLLDKILEQIERQQAVLAAVRARLPDQAQAGIERAMTVSRSQRLTALERLGAVLNYPGDGQPAEATDRAAATDTQLPPGQAKKTATAQAGPTDLPPGQAKKTATAQAGPTDLPPGQAQKTATTGPTPTAPGNSDGQGQGGPRNCSASSENSPNFCTPTPMPEPQGDGGDGDLPPATPTAPGNSGDQGQPSEPNCNASNPNSGNYCTPTPAPEPQGDSGGGSGGDPLPQTEPLPAEPTTCPLNPAGNPVCNNRP